MRSKFFKFWAFGLAVWGFMVALLIIRQHSLMESSIFGLIGIILLIVIRTEMYEVLSKYEKDMNDFFENQKKIKYE